MIGLIVLAVFVGLYILIGLKVVSEYERGIRFTLGKFSGIMGPGLNFVWPIFQRQMRVDIRTKVVDIPHQDCITKDNVSVKVNAVIYFEIIDAKKVIIQVEDYMYAVSQLAQTTMRDVVGATELDELLAEREKVSTKIREVVDKASDAWGIEIQSVEVKDIELPGDMKRTIAKQAEAEREKRAVIISSQGEVAASKNLSIAAKLLSSTPGALHLRTLATLNDISSDASNTIVFVMPLEILKAWGMEKK